MEEGATLLNFKDTPLPQVLLSESPKLGGSHQTLWIPTHVLGTGTVVCTDPASQHLWFQFYREATCLRLKGQKLGTPGWT